MRKISSVSSATLSLYHKIGETALLAPIPSGLGFPSNVAQSSYYPGNIPISREEIAAVSSVLEAECIHPENTRIRKCISGNNNDAVTYDVLQASVAVDTTQLPRKLQTTTLESGGGGGGGGGGEGVTIRLIRGDHCHELATICSNLQEARKFAANPRQEKFLSEYVDSFTTGEIEIYRNSQRTWVKDVKPSVETLIGFVEPYRDPYGVRAEFEGLVGIVHRGETEVLTTLVENSTKFIRRLPWAIDAIENDGKGPFEKESFENPDFTSLHSEFRLISLPRHFFFLNIFFLSSLDGNFDMVFLQLSPIARASFFLASICPMCAFNLPGPQGRQGLILLIEDSTMIYAKMLDLKMS